MVEADGARAALSAGGRIDHRLGERLVERQQKVAAAAAAGAAAAAVRLVDHAAQREAERGAARDEDVAECAAGHARRVVATRREPRRCRRRTAA